MYHNMAAYSSHLPQFLDLDWFIHPRLRLILPKEGRLHGDIHEYVESPDAPVDGVDDDGRAPEPEGELVFADEVHDAVPSRLAPRPANQPGLVCQSGGSSGKIGTRL